MKSIKTEKYKHVRTLNDLDNEILRLKIKKNILEQDLLQNYGDFKNSLLPRNLFREAIGFIGGPGNKLEFLNKGIDFLGNGKVVSYLKYITLALATIKEGSKLAKKIKEIVSR